MLGTTSRKQAALVAVAVSACACLIGSLLRRRRHRRTPPGTLGIPFLGETVQFALDPKAFVDTRIKKYGPIFKTNVLFCPVVVVTGDDAKLVSKMNTIGWPNFWMDILGKTSTAAINGPRHKFQRAVCSAAFTDEALEGYVPDVQRLTEKHLAEWAKFAEAGPIAPSGMIKSYAFDVAEQVLFATSSAESHGSLLQDFTDLINGLEALVPLNLPFLAFGKSMKARRKLLGVYQTIIDQKRSELANGAEAKDMLAIVIAEGRRGEPMTNEELLDFCILVQFAGHDTTKAAIESMLYFLDLQPEICSDLAVEVATMWDGQSQLTMKQIQACSLGKCGRFLDEVLRVSPPITHLFRVVDEDMEVGGYVIPSGWKVSLNTQQLHGTDEIQGLDMTVDHKTLRLCQNCPFGMGIRMCLGYKFAKLMLMVWLMCMVRNYQHKVGEASLHKFPIYYRRVTMTFSKKRAAK